MIRHNVSLDSSGRARLDNKAHELDLGYTSNRNVYALNVLAGPEWAGLAIRAFWHVPGGADPPASLVVDGSVTVPALVTARSGTGCITFEGPYSAYAIAVKYGYEGTEEQWIKEQEASRLDAKQSAEKAEAAAGRAESAQKAAESAKADALDAIGTSKQGALDAVQQAQNGAVKTVTDTQTTATKAVQTAQNTATGAVTKAQTAATAAVEKKGEEVLATIPEDYTNILARVAALESCGFVVVNGKVCMKYAKT